MNMNKTITQIIKSHILLTMLTLVAGLMMTVGVTFAIVNRPDVKTEVQSISLGTLDADLRTSETIVINDLYPQTEDELNDTLNKRFEFTIQNSSSFPLSYTLKLKDRTEAFMSENKSSYSAYHVMPTTYYKYIKFKFDNAETRTLDESLTNGEYVLKEGVLNLSANDSHKLQFWLADDAPNAIQGALLSFEISMEAVGKDDTSSFADYLIAKANPLSVKTYNTTTGKEMYTFEHQSTTQIGSQVDYRYIGNSPNNYVTFNGETWRIIGVFTIDGIQQVKMIREQAIYDLPWNSSQYPYYAADENDWATSGLRKVLNGDYFWKAGEYASKGINANSQALIGKTAWYHGFGNVRVGPSMDDIYGFERGTLTCKSMGFCETDRTLRTTGFVGLMYASDYIYTYAYGVNETCANTPRYCGDDSTGNYTPGNPAASWLYNILEHDVMNWTLTPYAEALDPSNYNYDETKQMVYVVADFGSVAPAGPVMGNVYVDEHPVVYLSTDVKRLSGDGSSSNRYVLDEPYAYSKGTYYFEHYADGRFVSNCQGVDNGTATTTLTFNKSYPNGITVYWTVSSEDNYDKITVNHNGTAFVSNQSGIQSGSYKIASIAAGDTIGMTYSKDGSVNKNDDTATVKIVFN